MAIRLALLICDTPNPGVLADHGGYLEIFTRFFQESIPDKKIEFVVDGYDVVHKQEYPSDDSEYDAVVITGSAASAYDDIPWITRLISYISMLAKTKPAVKIIGTPRFSLFRPRRICFGHQIVAHAFGAKCVPNNGRWEVGVYEVKLTEIGKDIFGTSSINIQQMHRDHVPVIPEKFKLLGSTDISPVQGMVLPCEDDPSKIHVFCVQGHPEFLSNIVNKIIDVRGNSDTMDAGTTEDGRARAIRPDDGTNIIGRTIWKVIGVESTT